MAAACSGLEHIIKRPLPENPTLLDQSLIIPWKQININSKKTTNNDNDNDNNHVRSFSEMFNDLYIHSSPESSTASTPSSMSSDSSFFADSKNPKTHLDMNGNIPKSGNKHVILNDDSCDGSFSDKSSTLGFESLDDEEILKYKGRFLEDGRIRVSKSSKRSSRRIKARSVGEFPPPISCIGISGKPLVCLKSFRQNGRIVIKELRAQSDEFMHAWRENGRLRMNLVHSDDEFFHEDEGDDDDERSSTSEESHENVDKDNGGNNKN